MFSGIKIRIAKLISGDYPLDYIIYRIFTRDRVISDSFPKKLYNLLGRKQIQIGNARELLIKTYDGLDQATHPSVCKFNGRYYLAVTPFPYGNDFYENPCLYKSKDGESFFPIDGCYPIVQPHKHDKLIYLSDPYLYTEDEKLKLIYRECSYYNKDQYKASIYSIELHPGIKRIEPTKLFDSETGGMSPCVILEDDDKYIYYVSFEGQHTSLKKKRFNSSGEYDVQVDGIPSDLMLWHIDIFIAEDNNTIGLFTMSTDHFGSGARLFVATNRDGIWTIGKEIFFDKKLITKMYKSCVARMDDGSFRLYVSVRRKDRKWKIYYLDRFKYQNYL